MGDDAHLVALKMLRVDADVAKAAAVHEELKPGVFVGTDLRLLRYSHPLLRPENAKIREE